jgi:3-dehydroquinate synthase
MPLNAPLPSSASESNLQPDRTVPATRVMPEIRTITVDVPVRPRAPHPIVMGWGVLSVLASELTKLGLPKDVVIISSPDVFGLHGESLKSALSGGGYRVLDVATFPDGEENKNGHYWDQLMKQVMAVDDRCELPLLIVNLGGGVVMDVGAFVAATFKRGIDYVQIPTTLLGDVDCGIGGKCGFNLDGKNLVGQFYQPRLVLSDLSFLKTLPDREIRSGIAEIIKYGAALDAEFFDYVWQHHEDLQRLDPKVVLDVVAYCFDKKIEIVKKDERDTEGVRARLNFGHTIGHALEAATDYVSYRHGEAIAIGMVCACEIAEETRGLSPEVTAKVSELCEAVGLPTRIDPPVELAQIMTYMSRDKKFRGNKNCFVLPDQLGATERQWNIDQALIEKVVSGRMGRC